MSDEPIPLGTKAESLARLTGRVRRADVLPLVHFTHQDWLASRSAVLDRVRSTAWGAAVLIVRSSALGEDSAACSQAGRYLTVPGVRGELELTAAVDKVFASYGTPRPGDQVLVQPALRDVRASGVACLPQPGTGAPYVVVSWCEAAATDIVTGGQDGDLRTWYGAGYDERGCRGPEPVPGVLALLAELRALTGVDRLDVEFAVTTAGRLVLLQVRPLTTVRERTSEPAHRQLLGRVAAAVADAGRAAPGTIGRRTVFGVMPDWNPAEMIGLRPRPLALSLYRHLITDGIWARARYRYGYRDLRGTPLLVDFAGLPYVDVRASVTSLVPRDLPTELAARLVDHWVDRLAANPELHDRLESRIVISSLGLRAPGRLVGLTNAGFTDREVEPLRASLRALTERILNGPLWSEELALVQAGAAPPTGTGPAALLARLDHCREYGTLPFAGLARAAFIATELLDDLVAEGVLSLTDKARYVGGLDLVASQLRHDFHQLDRAEFLARYGHLRPGTYDIRSPRYDEEPDRYFDWSSTAPSEPQPTFAPSGDQLAATDRLLARAGLDVAAPRLFAFVATSIRGRELAKFEFTRVLSDVLVDLRALGERLGFDAEDLSFVPVEVLATLVGDPARDQAALAEAVELGRHAHAATSLISLPPLLADPDAVWGFTTSRVRPSFVTQRRTMGRVADIDAGHAPDGAIALVSSADPGYDWLFARGIVGLVTAFGGVNSHMAIRALELDIPAAIGVGEQLFRRWRSAAALDLDAANNLVAVLP